MKPKIPSPAMIVALVALFVALGGSSYAAVALKANSVASKQIKNGSIQAADLAPAIRPAKSSRVFRAAVADVVTDPAADINIHVVGEKGDKGDQGANGANGVNGAPGEQGAKGDQGARGDQGPQGGSGPMGPAGNALAYGHLVTSGSDQDTTGSTAAGVTFSHPGGSVWCLNPGAQSFTSLTATADKPASGAAVFAPGSSANSCASGRWMVLTWLASGMDAEAVGVGFFFTAN